MPEWEWMRRNVKILKNREAWRDAESFCGRSRGSDSAESSSDAEISAAGDRADFEKERGRGVS
jgi:hypothetical protein